MPLCLRSLRVHLLRFCSRGKEISRCFRGRQQRRGRRGGTPPGCPTRLSPPPRSTRTAPRPPPGRNPRSCAARKAAAAVPPRPAPGTLGQHEFQGLQHLDNVCMKYKIFYLDLELLVHKFIFYLTYHGKHIGANIFNESDRMLELYCRCQQRVSAMRICET